MMRRKRICLDELLKGLSPREQCRVLMVTALGAVRAVRSEPAFIPLMEDIIFDPHMLRYCSEQLRDLRVRWVLEYGMELTDVHTLVRDPASLHRACDHIERTILRYLRKDQAKSDRSEEAQAE